MISSSPVGSLLSVNWPLAFVRATLFDRHGQDVDVLEERTVGRVDDHPAQHTRLGRARPCRRHERQGRRTLRAGGSRDSQASRHRGEPPHRASCVRVRTRGQDRRRSGPRHCPNVVRILLGTKRVAARRRRVDRVPRSARFGHGQLVRGEVVPELVVPVGERHEVLVRARWPGRAPPRCWAFPATRSGRAEVPCACTCCTASRLRDPCRTPAPRACRARTGPSDRPAAARPARSRLR